MDYSKCYAIVRHKENTFLETIFVIREIEYTVGSTEYQLINLDDNSERFLSVSQLFWKPPYGIDGQVINHRKALTETQSKNLQAFLDCYRLTTRINYKTWNK
jgi:hypothetical protein